MVNQESNRELIINDLVNKRSVIIPLIGDESIVYEFEQSGKQIEFQEYLVTRFQEKYPSVCIPDKTLHAMKEMGYYGLSLLSQFYNPTGRYLDDMMDIVNENKKGIRLKKEVREFLEVFDFPVILTTLCFDFIEAELSGYKSVWYQANKTNRVALQNNKCVYHLFGQASDGLDWVNDEETLLMFLLSHHHQDFKAISLIEYLQLNKKKLFVLGCNPPNWLFRFLWETTLSGTNNNNRTTRGYWVNRQKPIDSFENFLKKKNFSTDEQVLDILKSATTRLRNELNTSATREETEKQFDVFLSYASEDRGIATQIYNSLKERQVKVWFDDRGAGEITPGDLYWNKIQKGIEHSTFFMSVITGNWMIKQTSTSSLKTETLRASEWFNNPNNKRNNPKYSIPVVIVGSSFNGKEINPSYVELIGNNGIIPSNLFSAIDMIEYDNNPNVFEKINW